MQCTEEDAFSQLLKAGVQRFKAETLSKHPNRWKVPFAIDEVKRRNPPARNPAGLIVGLVQGSWQPESAAQRQLAAQPDHVQEQAVVGLIEQRAEIVRQRKILEALALWTPQKLRERIEHLAIVEPQEYMRRRWTDLLGLPPEQIPPTMLGAVYSGRPLTRPIALTEPAEPEMP